MHTLQLRDCLHAGELCCDRLSGWHSAQYAMLSDVWEWVLRDCEWDGDVCVGDVCRDVQWVQCVRVCVRRLVHTVRVCCDELRAEHR